MLHMQLFFLFLMQFMQRQRKLSSSIQWRSKLYRTHKTRSFDYDKFKH